MKKKLWLIVLMILCTGILFAQEEQTETEQTEEEKNQVEEKERKNAIYLDFFPLFKGIIATDGDAGTNFICFAFGYERLLASNISLGGELDLYFGNAYSRGAFYFSLTFQNRWYLLSKAFDKLFIGADIGINSFKLDWEEDAPDGGFFGVTIAVKAGWRILTKGIFLEPSMSYVLSKSNNYSIIAPLGWQGGLRFGYAF